MKSLRERWNKYWARQVVESPLLNTQFKEHDEHDEVIRKAVKFGGPKVYLMAFVHTMIKKINKKIDA